MKVCFVDCEGIHFGLNSGIGYIVSYLKNIHGYNSIKVFDFNNKKGDDNSRIEKIRSFDVIGFSIMSYTSKHALKIAHQVKTKNNILIAGGPHITLDGEYFLKTNDIFDIGVFGEGEATTVNLLKALEAKTDLGLIKGIFYRKDGKVVFTGFPDRILDLDSLPYPDFSVFDSVADGKIHIYPLITSRGCPYQCIFCCVKDVSGEKWTSRSVDKIIGELKKAKEDYHINRFNINDDNFSLDMNRVKRLCDELIKQNLKIRWSCYNGIRADKIDSEMMAKMKKAGCFAISIGIESVVQKEFNAVKKGEAFSDILKTIELAHLNHIAVCGNFIIGLPYSNLESVRTSIKFAINMRLNSCVFNLLVPFPGTGAWNWAEQNGRFLHDWREGFVHGKHPIVVFETDDFPKQDRIRAYYEANTKCKHYFAFTNDRNPAIINIFCVLKAILQYDRYRLPHHVFWWIKIFKRIFHRIKDKNS